MNKLGFGFLRLPRVSADERADVDFQRLNPLVDAFLAGGGTYFDTAYVYLKGKSEKALRTALVERYPREAYQVATKLPGYLVEAPGDCEKLFQKQCERTGLDWFDVYMLYWLNQKNYETAEKFDEFGFMRQLKAEGKARKIGFSYHGDATLLNKILTEHPEVDVVQLQINYLDWNDPGIQAAACYQAAVKHGKQVIVMEPVKGGTLASLPEEAQAILEPLQPGESAASWALRFAQDLDQVSIVLSGMNAMEQVQDNLRELPPLTAAERQALDQVCGILNRSIAIPCTGCRYCVSHCPQNIPIPDYFQIYNSYKRYPDDGWKMQPVYYEAAQSRGKASECIACRACQGHCPQNIPIADWVRQIADVMENPMEVK